MDNTDVYIEMCEQSDEVQNLKNKIVGVMYYVDTDYWGGCCGFGQSYSKEKAFCSTCGTKINTTRRRHVKPIITDNFCPGIWLPTQDQIQKMMYSVKKLENPQIPIRALFEESYVVRTKLLHNQNCNWGAYRNEYYLQFDSMEQLWFAFMMSEQFNKVWASGAWVIKNKVDKKYKLLKEWE